jgi:hypothetical protein
VWLTSPLANSLFVCFKTIQISVRYLQKAAGQRHNTVRAKAIKAMGALVDIGDPEVLQVSTRHCRVYS